MQIIVTNLDTVNRHIIFVFIPGLELAKMSCLPAEVLEEASTIAARLTKEKLLKDSSHPDDSSPKVEAHEIGRQLVQVARNSLLDTNGLR